MTRAQLYQVRYNYLHENYKYKRCYYKEFDYSVMDNIMYISRAGKGHKGENFNDCIMMADTETSKEVPGTVCKNYVVAWSLSIRAFDMNIVTLYGTKPSELVDCINKLLSHMPGNKTIIYWHNMSYDWTFTAKFFIREYGTPDKQLNVKSHYPLFINFKNGLIFKDSLILAQRKLEKWAEDLNVEHKKAVGKWDYNKKRNQNLSFTKKELDYIECDTLAGVECIQKTMDALGKHIYSIPYTATGIPREQVQKLAKKNKGRDFFKKSVPTADVQKILELVYHGGYTHANRHILEYILKDKPTICYDFSSSYPYCLLSEKFAIGKFTAYGEPVKPDFIIKNNEKYGFIFKLLMRKVKLKNDYIAMPALQFSKCTHTINAIVDNGRILCAEYAELYINSEDLVVIMNQYEWQNAVCDDVYYSRKGYLPRWFTDYVYQCYEDKCKLKNGDPVLYSIAKAKLNSLYGMCCQKPCRETIEEDYMTGEYITLEDFDFDAEYEKYTKRFTSVLLYQIGVWVTSFAFKNLFTLGSCCKNWYYSDTDSCYGSEWDEKKLKAYNDKCIQKLKANGYDAVVIDGKKFYPGVAELDGVYSEFVTLGSKRYACRYAPDQANKEKDWNKLKITVAGVPKKTGALCLNNTLKSFHKGFCFDGETTGKLCHTYFHEKDIWIDEDGNERGDSIDLSPTTYVLDVAETYDWEKLFEEEIEVIVYE